jgi:hypothetical protein
VTQAADLPRWGGITEPMTVFTNVVLSIVAFFLGGRLAYLSALSGSASGASIAGALVATSFAALLGAVAHGVDPTVDPALRSRFWRGALYATGPIGAMTLASVAFFAARGSVRTAILVVAALKLLVFIVRVGRRPEFRVAAADYGGALAVVLLGAAYAAFRWRAPGVTWLIGGVLVSLVGAVVQARRVGFHRHFNHNDFYHVIQLAALYAFYRGGSVLVDR